MKENILLKDYTTFKIGGPARYFTEARTKEQVVDAIQWAKDNSHPFFILGKGSNLLVSDKGFEGLVIRMELNNMHDLYIESGVEIDDMVKHCLDLGYTGMEWMAGIPGTVGGAIRGNAEAFKGITADIIEKVEALNGISIKEFSNRECMFHLKTSVFKKNKDLIILSCVFNLKKGKAQDIKQYLDYRGERHPIEPSAGCIFRNEGDIPSSALIEKAGLKGKTVGGAMVSNKHANFIINKGNATAKDVLDLIKVIKKEVKDKFNVDLIEEVQYLGS